MSQKKDIQRKRAEELVEQINALVEEHEGEKYFHTCRYKVVKFTLLKRLKVFMTYAAMSAVLMVLFAVVMSNVGGNKEAISLLTRIVEVPLATFFTFCFSFGVYYFVRWFSYCDDPLEVSYSEDDIRSLEEVLEGAKSAVAKYHQEKEEKADLLRKFKRLQEYIETELDGECKLNEKNFLMRVVVEGKVIFHDYVSEKSYADLLGKIVDVEERKRLIQEFEAKLQL